MVYHKTGTTWLQNELFTATSNIFVPISATKNGTLAENFIYDKKGYLLNSFDNNEQTIIENFNAITSRKNLSKNGRISVISHERLSGNPHSSGFDSSIIARRIQKTFPNSKIFVVIREQSSWILSNYFQYLSIGGTHSLKKYLNTKYDGKLPGFSPGHIEYHFLIKDYQTKFGVKNVLVLPYELFNSDKSLFFRKLGEFLETDICVEKLNVYARINVKSNHFINYKFRFLNAFIYSSSVNNYSSLNTKINRIFAFTVKKLLNYFISQKKNKQIQQNLRNEILEWTNKRFDESNLITQELINMNLEEFGYRTSTSV